MNECIPMLKKKNNLNKYGVILINRKKKNNLKELLKEQSKQEIYKINNKFYQGSQSSIELKLKNLPNNDSNPLYNNLSFQSDFYLNNNISNYNTINNNIDSNILNNKYKNEVKLFKQNIYFKKQKNHSLLKNNLNLPNHYNTNSSKKSDNNNITN